LGGSREGRQFPQVLPAQRVRVRPEKPLEQVLTVPEVPLQSFPPPPEQVQPMDQKSAERALPVIHLRSVSRRMAPGAAPVLRELDLSIREGELVNVVGPSGSGKTTLLRLLNRLDETDGGTVEILGRPVTEWPARALRRQAAFVFQEPVLLERTVREELQLPFHLWNEPPGSPESLVAALGAAGLEAEFLECLCKTLSVGQRQRVALARALVTRPRLLLLDEPTSGLDEQTAFQLLNNLREINRTLHTTVVVANHRLAEVRHLGGRLVVLLEGRLAADGPVEAVFAHPPGARIAAFLSGSRPNGVSAAGPASVFRETP